MNTPTAIIIAGVLIAFSVWFSSPTYQLEANGRDITRINVRNGEVSKCRSAEAVAVIPVCGEFGARSMEEYQEEQKQQPTN